MQKYLKIILAEGTFIIPVTDGLYIFITDNCVEINHLCLSDSIMVEFKNKEHRDFFEEQYEKFLTGTGKSSFDRIFQIEDLKPCLKIVDSYEPSNEPSNLF